MGAFGIAESGYYLHLTSVMHLSDPLAIDIPMKTTQEGLSPSHFVDFGGIMTVVSTKWFASIKISPTAFRPHHLLATLIRHPRLRYNIKVY